MDQDKQKLVAFGAVLEKKNTVFNFCFKIAVQSETQGSRMRFFLAFKAKSKV